MRNEQNEEEKEEGDEDEEKEEERRSRKGSGKEGEVEEEGKKKDEKHDGLWQMRRASRTAEGEIYATGGTHVGPYTSALNSSVGHL